MIYAHLEQEFSGDADPDAAAAAAIDREEEALLNQPADVSLLPCAVMHEIVKSHEAAIISVQCCSSESAVITGSGTRTMPHLPP